MTKTIGFLIVFVNPVYYIIVYWDAIIKIKEIFEVFDQTAIEAESNSEVNNKLNILSVST